MSEKDNTAVLETDGVLPADLFRRAAFNWALSTKRLVEASAALNVTAKVAQTALVDIEHARKMLNRLFLPEPSKNSLGYSEVTPTEDEVRASVAGVSARIKGTLVQPLMPLPITPTPPPPLPVAPKVPRPRRDPSVPRTHKGTDLTQPVYASHGRMLWAEIPCPSCEAVKNERCKKDDGGHLEKPHPMRKFSTDKP